MAINDLFSIVEAAEVLGCTTDNVRRLVMEDRKLSALLASPDGNLSQFHTAVGLQTYRVDSDGRVTDLVRGRNAGNVRFVKEAVFQVQADAARTSTKKVKETAATRNQRRYQSCLDAGLPMPDNDYATLPIGINILAKAEGISKQAFSKSVKKHIASMSG